MKMFARFFTCAAIAAAAPLLQAQTTTPSEKPSASRQDPLGLGDLNRDRPKGSTTDR